MDALHKVASNHLFITENELCTRRNKENIVTYYSYSSECVNERLYTADNWITATLLQQKAVELNPSNTNLLLLYELASETQYFTYGVEAPEFRHRIEQIGGDVYYMRDAVPINERYDFRTYANIAKNTLEQLGGFDEN